MAQVSDYTRFTKGDCGILARAIHKRTGWPVCTFTDWAGRPGLHAFVKRPDGTFLDIEGLADELAMRLRWNATNLTMQEFDAYEDLVAKDDRWAPAMYGNYSYLRAAQVAKRFVEKYGTC